MPENMGIRAYGFTPGEGRPGKYNLITDVPGVKVGHCTVESGRNKTGVTVVIPCSGSVYERKPVAASFVLNGFGKTIGTVQLEELGTLETPIAFTNTLNVGKTADALIEYTCCQCRKAGILVTTLNPVVGETNDSKINDITVRAVETEHVLKAIEAADIFFEQGAVGAGRGTVCFGLKGGIGSSSRVLTFKGKEYTVGALVQSNFGNMRDLTICGHGIGKEIYKKLNAPDMQDKGSVMVLIGTDIPLDSRQLKRVIKRAAVGLVRTGSCMGCGSGDVFLGFTNGNFMPDDTNGEPVSVSLFPENQLDTIFRLTAEAVEEAVLNSLIYAGPETGIDGEIYHCLSEFL